ncbi:MAG: NADH-quinone oxidoreductase subunit NuoE [Fretibacterium sp.]|nr:NADH-quinone oxidoreductase subunit NuoE [Fretibacterium sp.]
METQKQRKGALMPVLQDAQSRFGYLPKEVMEMIAEGLKVPMSEIYGVATFYSQFTFFPKGEYDISVCLGTACYVKGVESVLEALEEELGIKAGETTPDLQFSITPTRCLGACGIAPVVSVNGELHGHMSKDTVKELLDSYRCKNKQS